MPSLLKDRSSGSLGRLIAGIRPGRAGPLPVQTGFPTSLADLFVKNHGRLKKPSSYTSKRKKRGGGGGGVSPLPSSPSPSRSPPTPSSPSPPVAVPPSTQPRPAALPRVEYVCDTRGDGAFGLGLGFLALAAVVSLALLVIWSRKVVAAVTVAAFSLFLLESVRTSSPHRRARPPAATQVLDLDGRGYASPIREVEAAESEPPRRSCSDSDMGTHIPAFAVEESSDAGGHDSCDWKPKRKQKQRSWKRLIPRKLQKGRKSKEAESSGSFRSESSETEALVGGNAKAADSRRGRGSQADAEADAVTRSSHSSGRLDALDADVRCSGGQIEAVEASADLTAVEDVVIGIRFPFVFVVVIVLLGLVGGRLPAVAFTVLCSASVSWMQRLTRDGEILKGGD